MKALKKAFGFGDLELEPVENLPYMLDNPFLNQGSDMETMQVPVDDPLLQYQQESQLDLGQQYYNADQPAVQPEVDFTVEEVLESDLPDEQKVQKLKEGMARSGFLDEEFQMLLRNLEDAGQIAPVPTSRMPPSPPPPPSNATFQKAPDKPIKIPEEYNNPETVRPPVDAAPTPPKAAKVATKLGIVDSFKQEGDNLLIALENVPLTMENTWGDYLRGMGNRMLYNSDIISQTGRLFTFIPGLSYLRDLPIPEPMMPESAGRYLDEWGKELQSPILDRDMYNRLAEKFYTKEPLTEDEQIALRDLRENTPKPFVGENKDAAEVAQALITSIPPIVQGLTLGAVMSPLGGWGAKTGMTAGSVDGAISQVTGGAIRELDTLWQSPEQIGDPNRAKIAELLYQKAPNKIERDALYNRLKRTVTRYASDKRLYPHTYKKPDGSTGFSLGSLPDAMSIITMRGVSFPEWFAKNVGWDAVMEGASEGFDYVATRYAVQKALLKELGDQITEEEALLWSDEELFNAIKLGAAAGGITSAGLTSGQYALSPAKTQDSFAEERRRRNIGELAKSSETAETVADQAKAFADSKKQPETPLQSKSEPGTIGAMLEPDPEADAKFGEAPRTMQEAREMDKSREAAERDRQPNMTDPAYDAETGVTTLAETDSGFVQDPQTVQSESTPDLLSGSPESTPKDDSGVINIPETLEKVPATKAEKKLFQQEMRKPYGPQLKASGKVLKQAINLLGRTNKTLANRFKNGDVQVYETLEEAQAAFPKENLPADVEAFRTKDGQIAYIAENIKSEPFGKPRDTGDPMGDLVADTFANRPSWMGGKLTPQERMAQRVLETVNHEFEGHQGLRDLMSDDQVDELLTNTYFTYQNEIDAYRALNDPNMSDQVATEEYLVQMYAEKGIPKFSWQERTAQKVRKLALNQRAKRAKTPEKVEQLLADIQEKDIRRIFSDIQELHRAGKPDEKKTESKATPPPPKKSPKKPPKKPAPKPATPATEPPEETKIPPLTEGPTPDLQVPEPEVVKEEEADPLFDDEPDWESVQEEAVAGDESILTDDLDAVAEELRREGEELGILTPEKPAPKVINPDFTPTKAAKQLEAPPEPEPREVTIDNPKPTIPPVPTKQVPGLNLVRPDTDVVRETYNLLSYIKRIESGEMAHPTNPESDRLRIENTQNRIKQNTGVPFEQTEIVLDEWLKQLPKKDQELITGKKVTDADPAKMPTVEKPPAPKVGQKPVVDEQARRRAREAATKPWFKELSAANRQLLGAAFKTPSGGVSAVGKRIAKKTHWGALSIKDQDALLKALYEDPVFPFYNGDPGSGSRVDKDVEPKASILPSDPEVAAKIKEMGNAYARNLDPREQVGRVVRPDDDKEGWMDWAPFQDWYRMPAFKKEAMRLWREGYAEGLPLKENEGMPPAEKIETESPPSPDPPELEAPEVPKEVIENLEGTDGSVTDDTTIGIIGDQENIFETAAKPTLQNRRDQPELEEDERIDTATISGGDKERDIIDRERRGKKFAEIGYKEKMPDPPGAQRAVRSRYGNQIPNVRVHSDVQNWAGAHFNGGVGIGIGQIGRNLDEHISRILLHEFGHAAHSLVGDQINQLPNVEQELQNIEEFLYPNLRNRVEASMLEEEQADGAFFSYLLSPEELIAEFNVFIGERADGAYNYKNYTMRGNGLQLRNLDELAPGIAAALRSVDNDPNLVVVRNRMPAGIVGKTEAVGMLKFNPDLEGNPNFATELAPMDEEHRHSRAYEIALVGELRDSEDPGKALADFDDSQITSADGIRRLAFQQGLVGRFPRNLFRGSGLGESQIMQDPATRFTTQRMLERSLGNYERSREAGYGEEPDIYERKTREQLDKVLNYNPKEDPDRQVGIWSRDPGGKWSLERQRTYDIAVNTLGMTPEHGQIQDGPDGREMVWLEKGEDPNELMPSEPVANEVSNEPYRTFMPKMVANAEAQIPTEVREIIGEDVPAQLEIVDLRDILISHDMDGRFNTDYARAMGVQPRPRVGISQDEKLRQMVTRPDANLVIENTAIPGAGAPILSNQGAVLSGNNRGRMMRYLFDEFQRKQQNTDSSGFPNAPEFQDSFFGAYERRFLRDAQNNGFNPLEAQQELKRIREAGGQGILVRRLTEELDYETAEELANYENKPQVAARSFQERAVEVGSRLSIADVDAMVTQDGLSVTKQSVREKVRLAINSPVEEAIHFDQKTGELTPDGERLMTLALFSKAYPPEFVGELARSLSLTNPVRALRDAIPKRLAVIAKFQEIGDQSRINAMQNRMDRLYYDWREAEQVHDELAENPQMNADYSNMAEVYQFKDEAQQLLVSSMRKDGRKASATAMRKRFDEFHKALLNHADPIELTQLPSYEEMIEAFFSNPDGPGMMVDPNQGTFFSRAFKLRNRDYLHGNLVMRNEMFAEDDQEPLWYSRLDRALDEMPKDPPARHDYEDDDSHRKALSDYKQQNIFDGMKLGQVYDRLGKMAKKAGSKNPKREVEMLFGPKEGFLDRFHFWQDDTSSDEDPRLSLQSFLDTNRTPEIQVAMMDLPGHYSSYLNKGGSNYDETSHRGVIVRHANTQLNQPHREGFEGAHFQSVFGELEAQGSNVIGVKGPDMDVLFFAAVQDRVHPLYGRLLFVDQLQSDWFQDGNKYGYGEITEDERDRANAGIRQAELRVDQLRMQSVEDLNAAYEALRQFYMDKGMSETREDYNNRAFVPRRMAAEVGATTDPVTGESRQSQIEADPDAIPDDDMLAIMNDRPTDVDPETLPEGALPTSMFELAYRQLERGFNVDINALAGSLSEDERTELERILAARRQQGSRLSFDPYETYLRENEINSFPFNFDPFNQFLPPIHEAITASQDNGGAFYDSFDEVLGDNRALGLAMRRLRSLMERHVLNERQLAEVRQKFPAAAMDPRVRISQMYLDADNTPARREAQAAVTEAHLAKDNLIKKVPEHPFMSQDWYKRALNLVTKMAYDEGYDGVSLSTGAQTSKYNDGGAKLTGARTWYDTPYAKAMKAIAKELKAPFTELNTAMEQPDSMYDVVDAAGFPLNPTMVFDPEATMTEEGKAELQKKLANMPYFSRNFKKPQKAEARRAREERDRAYQQAYREDDYELGEQLEREAAAANGYVVSDVWHGTGANIEEFQTGRAGLIYFSENKEFSEGFVTGSATMRTDGGLEKYYLRPTKTFDVVHNPEHRARAIQMFNDAGGWAAGMTDDDIQDTEYEFRTQEFPNPGILPYPMTPDQDRRNDQGELSWDFNPTFDNDWELFDNLEVDLLSDLKQEGYDHFVFRDADGESITHAVIRPEQIKRGKGFALNDDGELQNLSERFRADHPNVHYSRNFLHPRRFKEGFDRAMLGISGLVDPFAYITHREDLLTLRNRLKGEIQVTQQIAERVGEVFGDKKNTPEELLEVYNFLTQALPESSISSDALRSTAVEVRDLISDFGQQLVDRRLLKKATYEKHKDKYLPQVYLKYMMDDQLVQVLSTGRKPSPQNYLKERKLNPEARAEDLLIMEILGHIKDPAFLANQSITTIGRDLAILRFLDEVAENENWAVKDQFTGWSYWDEFDNVLEDMVAEERMNAQERQLIRRNLKLDQLPPKLNTGHHVDQLKPGQTYLKEYAKELQKQRRAEMKEPGFDPNDPSDVALEIKAVGEVRRVFSGLINELQRADPRRPYLNVKKLKNRARAAANLLAIAAGQDTGVGFVSEKKQAAGEWIIDNLDDESINMLNNAIDDVMGMRGNPVTATFLDEEGKRIVEQIASRRTGPYAEALNRMSGFMLNLKRDLYENSGMSPDGKPRENVVEGRKVNWVQMPKHRRYGNLRGMWVREEIYDDIVGFSALEPKTDNHFKRLISGENSYANVFQRVQKFATVPINLPSIPRNFIGNKLWMWVLTGMRNWPKYNYLAAKALLSEPGERLHKYKQLFEKYGLGISTFSNVELKGARTALLEHELRIKRKNKQLTKAEKEQLAQEAGIPLEELPEYDYGQLWKLWTENQWNKFTSTFGKPYQFIEYMDKLAVLIYAMEKLGKSEEEAVRMAEDALFDYSLVKPWVREGRTHLLGGPYLTYGTKVMETLPRYLSKDPLRVGTRTGIMLAAQYQLLDTLSQLIQFGAEAAYNSLFGEDEDDISKRLRGREGDWMQKNPSMALMPYKDSRDRYQFTDTSYFVPTGSFSRAAQRVSEIDPLNPISYLSKGVDAYGEITGFTGGFVMNLLVGYKTGVDPFTGRQFVDPNLPIEHQEVQKQIWLANASTPGMVKGLLDVFPKLTSGLDVPSDLQVGAFRKLMDALASQELAPNFFGENTNRDSQGRLKADTAQAIQRFFGLNLYSVDPEESRRDAQRQMLGRMLELQRAGRTDLRDETDEDRIESRKEYWKGVMEEMKKKYQEQQAPLPNYNEMFR